MSDDLILKKARLISLHDSLTTLAISVERNLSEMERLASELLGSRCDPFASADGEFMRELLNCRPGSVEATLRPFMTNEAREETPYIPNHDEEIHHDDDINAD